MGSKSDFLEKELLDHVIGAATYTPPATLYFALFTSGPNDAGGGVEVSTSGTGYARSAVTNNATNFPAATGSSPSLKTNAVAVVFPAPVGSNWGTITHFAVFDAASAGNLLYWGALDASKVVNAGDAQPQFNPGSLSFTED